MTKKVKNKTQRDDLIKDRLYPFLYSKGTLKLKKLYIIRSHVFLINDQEGKEFILKKHKRIEHVKQQWNFFRHIKQSKVIVPFTHFPNGNEYISDQHIIWTITPYIQGRKLYFEKEVDRKLAVKALKQFHNEAFKIFPTEPIIQKELFIARWRRRLNTFKETEYLFKQFGYHTLYKDIVKTMVLYLERASRIPWRDFDNDAKQNGQWIHGDVASHNFIMSNDSKVRLIDFDLLTMGLPLHDYIQLGQRFLSHIDWNIDELLAYQMVSDRHIKYWLAGILIPSDVLREWIYFISRNSITSVPAYLAKMEANWIVRGHFLKMAQSMLKSM